VYPYLALREVVRALMFNPNHRGGDSMKNTNQAVKDSVCIPYAKIIPVSILSGMVGGLILLVLIATVWN
jgi:hypothetical protein